VAQPDPKVVLQAHALRARLTRQALMHGNRRPRTRHGGVRTFLVSAGVAVLLLVAVVVVGRVAAAMHGH
jgi:hypothetical protein